MATAYNPKIVTDGLVLYLDAANPKSYPGSGTSWFDLSGNGNHGTLINGPLHTPSNNGYIFFDGSNQYAVISGSPQFAVGLNGCVEQWVYVTGNDGINNRFWCTNNNMNSFDAYLAGSSYVVGFHGGRFFTLNPIPTNSWVHFVVAYNLGSASVYFNTNQQNLSGTPTGIDITNQDNFFIARYRTSPYELYGRISVMRVYNRFLSALEVQQNFNATRSRYGL